MHTLLLARRNKRRLLQGGVGAFPSVALQRVGGAWVVVDDNHDRPDGYFVLSGGKLVIDTTAASGLPIAASGPLLVGS